MSLSVSDGLKLILCSSKWRGSKTNSTVTETFHKVEFHEIIYERIFLSAEAFKLLPVFFLSKIKYRYISLGLKISIVYKNNLLPHSTDFPIFK